jgi:hypothetical protein
MKMAVDAMERTTSLPKTGLKRLPQKIILKERRICGVSEIKLRLKRRRRMRISGE